MTQHRSLRGAQVFLTLAAAAMLTWWGGLMINPPPSDTPSIAKAAVGVFVSLQVVSWLSVFMLVRKGQHHDHPSVVTVGLPLAVTLTVGQLAYWFTPVLGAPVLVLTLALALVAMIVTVRTRAESAGISVSSGA